MCFVDNEAAKYCLINMDSASEPNRDILAAVAEEEEGGAKKGRTRHDIVRQVMKEKGMNLIEATKYVKEHSLR